MTGMVQLAIVIVFTSLLTRTTLGLPSGNSANFTGNADAYDTSGGIKINNEDFRDYDDLSIGAWVKLQDTGCSRGCGIFSIFGTSGAGQGDGKGLYFSIGDNNKPTSKGQLAFERYIPVNNYDKQPLNFNENVDARVKSMAWTYVYFARASTGKIILQSHQGENESRREYDVKEPLIRSEQGFFTIGCVTYQDQVQWGFRGEMDEVRIWNKTFSSQEVIDIASNPPIDDPNLLYYFDFESGFDPVVSAKVVTTELIGRATEFVPTIITPPPSDNPSPPATTNTFPNIEPRLDCIIQNNANSFTAILGWETTSTIEVPIGDDNMLTAPGSTQSPPTEFLGSALFYPSDGPLLLQYSGGVGTWILGKGVIQFDSSNQNTRCVTTEASLSIDLDDPHPLDSGTLTKINVEVANGMGVDVHLTTAVQSPSSKKRQAQTTVTVTVSQSVGVQPVDVVGSFVNNSTRVTATINGITTSGDVTVRTIRTPAPPTLARSAPRSSTPPPSSTAPPSSGYSLRPFSILQLWLTVSSCLVFIFAF